MPALRSSSAKAKLIRPIQLQFLLNFAVFGVSASLLLYFVNRYVPFNTDEFLAHAIIARFRYPMSQLNLYRENFVLYDLTPRGIWSFIPTLPLRTYTYVGSAQALFYLPIYWLMPTPTSVRLLGLCMLAIQAGLIGSLFGIV